MSLARGLGRGPALPGEIKRAEALLTYAIWISM
jgi:hypothetical protein